MAKQFNWKEQNCKDLFPKWTGLKLYSHWLSLAYVYTQLYHSFHRSCEHTSKHSQYAMAFKKALFIQNVSTWMESFAHSERHTRHGGTCQHEATYRTGVL